MVKKYKIVKLEEEVHQNLIKLRALFELQSGRRFTISEVIADLVEKQPTFQVTAEEVEENH